MKNFITLLYVLFSSVSYADSNAVSPTPVPFGNCKQTCDDYKKDRDATSAAAQSCGVPPTSPDGGSRPFESNGKHYNSYADCLADLIGPSAKPGDTASFSTASRWRVLGQECDTWELSSIGRDADMATAITFTVVGSVCATACILQYTPFAEAAAGPAIVACEVTGGAATLADIGVSTFLTIKGESYQNWWDKAFTWTTTATNVAGTAAGGAAVLARTAAGRALVDAAVKKGASESALWKAARAAPCVAAGFFYTTAAAKWAGYVLNRNLSSNTCDAISGKDATGLLTYDQSKPTDVTRNNDPSLNSSSNSSSAVSGASRSNTITGMDIASISAPIQDYFSGNGSAAIAGLDKDKYFGPLPNLGKMNEALEKMGTSVSDIAKQLQNSPPGAVGSSIVPNMPAELADHLKELDEAAKSGQIQMVGGGDNLSVMTSRGGGSRTLSSTKPFGGLFGGLGTAAGPSPQKEMGFEKKAEVAIPSDGDIWHSNWNGTIFQLVSNKLVKTNERIDKLEWETPLNRALNGLPPLKNSKQRGK